MEAPHSLEFDQQNCTSSAQALGTSPEACAFDQPSSQNTFQAFIFGQTQSDTQSSISSPHQTFAFGNVPSSDDAGQSSVLPFSSDGTRIVSGSRDSTIKAWDNFSGQAIHTLAAGYDNGYKSRYIFFYGTLRISGRNYERISNQPDIEYVGQFKTKSKYSLIGLKSGSFPYASEYSFDNYSKVNIVGDLYEIKRNKEAFLKHIDELEYNYSRKFAVLNVNGNDIKSYIYLLANPDLIRDIEPNIVPNGRQRFVYIDSGDWIGWTSKK